MVRDLEIFVVLIILLIGVFCIFNARGIVRNKMLKKINNENRNVYIVKVMGYLITVLGLLALYFILN